MRKLIIAASILLVFVCVPVSGQTVKINPKFGNISKEELSMTSYAPDTSAAAVVLYRNTEIQIAMDNKLYFSKKTTITERYKILRESGKDCADYKLFIDQKDDRITNIKVSTYNLENGKTVVSKLPKKLIFEEKYSENTNTVSFSAQDVKVGSVVEVQFTVTSPRYWDIGTIYLQGRYPVNTGNIVVDYTDYFNFNKMTRGFLPFKSNKTSQRNEPLVLTSGENLTVTFNTDTYTAWDIPAVKIEKYNYYPDQARLGVQYELRSISIPDFMIYRDYTTTWQNVDKQFADEGFLKEFQKKLPFAAEVEAAAKEAENEEDAIRRVRKIVAGKVEWNGKTALFPNTDKAVREGTGDNADFCGVMGSALNRIGYKAEPVLIKSRTRGALAVFHIAYDTFDTVILKVTTPSGKVYYSDFAANYAYLDVLPDNLVIPEARLLDLSGNGSWVSLTDKVKNSSKQQAIATVSPDGVVSGQFRITETNQMAMETKRAFDDCKDEEEAIEAMEKSLDIEISSIDTKSFDEWSPDAVLSINFKYDAQLSGDLMYLRPFIRKYQSASDFADPVRTTPVDFPYSEDLKYKMAITIPEGYAVESLPENVSVACDPIGSRASAQFSLINGNTVVVVYSFNRSVNKVLETSYSALRDYWEKLADLYNSMIVIKKQ